MEESSGLSSRSEADLHRCPAPYIQTRRFLVVPLTTLRSLLRDFLHCNAYASPSVLLASPADLLQQ